MVDLPINNISQKIPVEGWTNKKAKVVISNLKKNGGSLSSDSIKLRKNQARVCARGEASDPKLANRIARLEANHNLCKDQMKELQDGVSKKLDEILNAVAKQSSDDGDTSSNNIPHFNKYEPAAQTKDV